MNAQWSRGSLPTMFGSSIQLAPSSIQVLSVRICSSVSRSPLGGMRTSASSLVTRSIRSDSPDLPGTIDGPFSPPRNAAALLSSRSPDFCFSGPWQE